MQMARWFVPFTLASLVLVSLAADRSDGGC